MYLVIGKLSIIAAIRVYIYGLKLYSLQVHYFQSYDKEQLSGMDVHPKNRYHNSILCDPFRQKIAKCYMLTQLFDTPKSPDHRDIGMRFFTLIIWFSNSYKVRSDVR